MCESPATARPSRLEAEMQLHRAVALVHFLSQDLARIAEETDSNEARGGAMCFGILDLANEVERDLVALSAHYI